MSLTPIEWSVRAQNLPEHASNAIHTDAGAQAAGFPRALVAGVTTYAYLTHPLVAAWGLDWVATGGCSVRFRRPVFDQDLLHCAPTPDADEQVATIEARTDEPDQPRAVLTAVRAGEALRPLRDGERLPTKHVPLDGEWSADYGVRVGDDLDVYSLGNIVHPAVWPALANHVFATELVRGSWIHTRSDIRHHALAPAGAVAEVQSVVVRRFESHGERAIVDIHINVNGITVASLEHEAIIKLPDS
jgi:acyl dehydratase